MLVTFGRMATNELRLRVRERLVAVEGAWPMLSAPERPPPAAQRRSRRHAHAPVTRTSWRRRRQRVARALADFDAATIATTHEFCLQMLDGLGVLGDREPHATFVEHLSDLTREVATDLLPAPLRGQPAHRRSATRRRSRSPTRRSRPCTPGWCPTG